MSCQLIDLLSAEMKLLTEMVAKATKTKFKVGERNAINHIYYFVECFLPLSQFRHNSDRHMYAFKAIFLIVKGVTYQI